MGRADAQARRDALLAFFQDDGDDGGGRPYGGFDETGGRTDPDGLTLGT